MKIENELGFIDISRKAIADIVSYTVMNCYGVVGMSRSIGREELLEILTGSLASHGVIIRNVPGNMIDIDVFVIIEQSVKVSVVAENIIDAIKYAVEQQTQIKVHKVDVNIVGIRM